MQQIWTALQDAGPNHIGLCSNQARISIVELLSPFIVHNTASGGRGQQTWRWDAVSVDVKTKKVTEWKHGVCPRPGQPGLIDPALKRKAVAPPPEPRPKRPRGPADPAKQDATADGKLLKVWRAVVGLKDTAKRVRAALFMQVPEKVTVGDPIFPPPQLAPPARPVGQYGHVDLLVEGVLPNMGSKLPSPSELWRWTVESQAGLWKQRRAFYNRQKLGELQKLCRKAQLWPGGDIAYVRDRLVRHD